MEEQKEAEQAAPGGGASEQFQISQMADEQRNRIEERRQAEADLSGIRRSDSFQSES